MTEEHLFGFDGAADDVYVVVMRRGRHGHWEIDSAEAPDDFDILAAVADILSRSPAQLPALPPPDVPHETVSDWLAKHADQLPVLDAWQNEALLRFYEQGPDGESFLGRASAAIQRGRIHHG